MTQEYRYPSLEFLIRNEKTVRFLEFLKTYFFTFFLQVNKVAIKKITKSLYSQTREHRYISISFDNKECLKYLFSIIETESPLKIHKFSFVSDLRNITTKTAIEQILIAAKDNSK